MSATPLHDSMDSITPDRETFRRLAQQGNLIPVYRDILADMETPVSAFKRLERRPNAFLLESVEGGERLARYSFFGSDPYLTFRSRGHTVTIVEGDKTRHVELSEGRDPLHVLQEILADVRYVELPGLPRFVGGAVGYIGYDWVRFLEPIGDNTEDDLQVDDVHLLLTDTLCIFDHVRHRIRVLANARIEAGSGTDAIDRAYEDAITRIEELVATLEAPLPAPTPAPVKKTNASDTGETEAFVSNMTRERYRAMALKGKEYIAAGDIIQAVLAQRFSRPLHAEAFDVYRALRSINPSPYMFYLSLDSGVTLVGASPEILVTEEKGKVTIRPIAGTRKRGRTPEEDALLAAELLADEKERAEHIMLVDLARNDIGRVCEYGSIKVNELMTIEKYSHVMHIVSNVVGRLRQDQNAFDLLRATFPAGTLSGAPKVRAMQIIEELEPTRRGTYGGAIGYISYNGNFDACITLRTALIKDGMAHVQAGGGIVADSDPDLEYEETVSKSAAVRRAVEMAEHGLNRLPATAAAIVEPIVSRWDRLEIENVIIRH